MKKIIVFAMLFVSQVLVAGNVIGDDSQAEWISDPVYDPRGKIDPFQPIFSDDHNKPVLKVHQIECVSNPLLEKLHLSQLELSGIVITEHKSIALVQEANGKGHIINQDMCIDNGKVAEILKDQIIVHTEMQDIHGVVGIKRFQMKLKKEIN